MIIVNEELIYWHKPGSFRIYKQAAPFSAASNFPI